MGKDVHKDNALKHLEAQKKEARLAHAAYEFFEGTTEGKELYEYLAHESGANLPSFSPRDNFNSNAAAFRDGMRAQHLKVQNLIKHHKESHE